MKKEKTRIGCRKLRTATYTVDNKGFYYIHRVAGYRQHGRSLLLPPLSHLSLMKTSSLSSPSLSNQAAGHWVCRRPAGTADAPHDPHVTLCSGKRYR